MEDEVIVSQIELVFVHSETSPFGGFGLKDDVLDREPVSLWSEAFGSFEKSISTSLLFTERSKLSCCNLDSFIGFCRRHIRRCRVLVLFIAMEDQDMVWRDYKIFLACAHSEAIEAVFTTNDVECTTR